jgi:translation initiation factor IF-1
MDMRETDARQLRYRRKGTVSGKMRKHVKIK